jgi:Ca2+-binding RTX toxin-like protein
MAFTVSFRAWDRYPVYPALMISGTSPSYRIDWGDGTYETITGRGPNADGRYSDIVGHRFSIFGGYRISVREGDTGDYVGVAEVITAYYDTRSLTATVYSTLPAFVSMGSGDDTIRSNAGSDVLLAGDGDDLVTAGRGRDSVWGGNGDDRLRGNAGDDDLWGGAGNDRLNAGAALTRDILRGELGDDVLIGGTGSDMLIGGNGRDKLRGGDGADVFVFALARAEGGGSLTSDPDRDVVVDFVSGEDRLDFRDYASGDRPTAFIGREHFGADGPARTEIRVRYHEDTIIEIDYGGDGVVDATVRLQGIHTLTTADFLL